MGAALPTVQEILSLQDEFEGLASTDPGLHVAFEVADGEYRDFALPPWDGPEIDRFRRLSLKGGRMLVRCSALAEQLAEGLVVSGKEPDDAWYGALIAIRPGMVYWDGEGGDPAGKVPEKKKGPRKSGRLFWPDKASCDLLERLALLAEHVTQAKSRKATTRMAANENAGVIRYLGDKQYAVGDDVRVVTDGEDASLQPFIGHPALMLDELTERSSGRGSPKALKRLQAKYDGIFGPFIECPGTKSSGGYRVKIKSQAKFKHPSSKSSNV